MTLSAELAAARQALERAGIPPIEAAVDADLLARAVLGWDRARLLASLGDPAPPDFHDRYTQLVARRERREPAAYIVGRREFWKRDFEVGPGVLVPRPETEFIVDEALARLSGRAAHHSIVIADVGTGSGCLAVTLALELPRSRVIATDTSRAALRIAERNADRHGVGDRVEFVETNVLADVDDHFDLIVSNPPYVPDREVSGLQTEVRNYEPAEALMGGTDGLDVVRTLLLEAESRLRDDGLLIFEFGFRQEDEVRAAVASRPAFLLDTVRCDLQGIPRTAVVRWQPQSSTR